MKYLSLACMLAIAMFFVSNASCDGMSPDRYWPVVLPAKVIKQVSSESSKIEMDLFSKDEPTKKLYTLRCNKGDSDDKVKGEDDYYGMFQCHFIPLSEFGSDLLEGEDAWSFGKSYNTRGVFKYEQLIGPCRNDPEFGFHREFNMRGMRLALTITNFSSTSIIDMVKHKVEPRFSFDFEANVIPNASATSKYTWPSAKKYCGGYYEVNAAGEVIYHESLN